MDVNIRYKTFANRSTQDLRFDQILQATRRPSSTTSSDFSSPPSSSVSFTSTAATTTTSMTTSAPLSPRKRVNIVTFSPQESQEVITRSPNKSPELSYFATNFGVAPHDPSPPPSPPLIPPSSPPSLPPVRLKVRISPTSCNLVFPSTNGGSSITTADSALPGAVKRKSDSESQPPPLQADKCPRMTAVDNESSHAEKSGPIGFVKSNPISDTWKTNPTTSTGPTTTASPFRVTKVASMPPMKVVGASNSQQPVSTAIDDKSLATPVSVTRPPLQSSGNIAGPSAITSSKPSIHAPTTASTSATQTAAAKSDVGNVLQHSEHSLASNTVAPSEPRRAKSLFTMTKKKVSYNHRAWQDEMDEEEIGQQKSVNVPHSTPAVVNTAARSQQPRASTVGFEFGAESEPASSHIIPVRSVPALHRSSTTIPVVSGGRTCDQPFPPEPDQKADSETRAPWRVPRSDKPLFAVVRQVKEAHECQEIGETQALLDDVEYIIDCLSDRHPASTRVLSVLNFSKKCLSRSFRDMLKAHGLLQKVFGHLHDSYTDQSLAVCTAGLFYIVARDRQPCSLDQDALKLMLRLMEPPGQTTGVPNSRVSKETERIRLRVKQMLDTLHKEKSAGQLARASCCRHIQPNQLLTARDLVLESILQLGTRKAADWFKRELREHGGLDRVGEAVVAAVEYCGDGLECGQQLDEFVVDRLDKVCHYTRLMENMTYMNKENQSHLVRFQSRGLMDCLARCLRWCTHCLPQQRDTALHERRTLISCLLGILRLLLNVSHDNEWTSGSLGGCPNLLETCLTCVLSMPRHVTTSKRFDLLVLSLGLLINLAEHCTENRARLVHMDLPAAATNLDDEVLTNGDEGKVNALEALTKLFLYREERARNHELERDDEVEEGAEGGAGSSSNSRSATATSVGETRTPAAEGDKQEEEGEKGGLQWRLIEDKDLERKRRGLAGGGVRGGRGKKHGHLSRSLRQPSAEENAESESEEEDEEDGGGADVEFLANSQEEEEKLQERLTAAGQHMEDSVVAAYTALLLGCIMQNSRRYADRIRYHLPDGKFRPLALMLAKFLSFLSLTNGMGQAGGASILGIIRVLEAQDDPTSGGVSSVA